MKFDSLSKRVKNLEQKMPLHRLLTQGDEWEEMKHTCLTFLEHRFPDAYLAMISGIDQIEAMDKSGEIKGGMHALVCLMGNALDPYLDARIALASYLTDYTLAG